MAVRSRCVLASGEAGPPFVALSAMVRNDLTEDGEAFGCFVTEIKNGQDRSSTFLAASA